MPHPSTTGLLLTNVGVIDDIVGLTLAGTVAVIVCDTAEPTCVEPLSVVTVTVTVALVAFGTPASHDVGSVNESDVPTLLNVSVYVLES